MPLAPGPVPHLRLALYRCRSERWRRRLRSGSAAEARDPTDQGLWVSASVAFRLPALGGLSETSKPDAVALVGVCARRRSLAVQGARAVMLRSGVGGLSCAAVDVNALWVNY
jgi:hypothetical protein